MDTVRTKAVAQKVKFLGHGGGDCTYAGQSLHEPKLPQIFVANKSCFQQLPEVQGGTGSARWLRKCKVQGCKLLS